MATKKTKNSWTVDLEELLEAGVHFGHQSRRWNPRMAKYIWQAQDKVHVFDLIKTQDLLEKACEFLFEQAKEGKRIVMVGSKRQAADIVKEVATNIGVGYMTTRWLGGTITNWQQISGRVKKLVDMKAAREAGEYKKYTKREQVMLDKEIDRLERFFGGLVDLSDKPEVIFVVDTMRERTAVAEANAKGIKVVAICDTNSDPSLVDYVIPGNDDAARSIKLLVETAGTAIAEGKKLAKKAEK